MTLGFKDWVLKVEDKEVSKDDNFSETDETGSGVSQGNVSISQWLDEYERFSRAVERVRSQYSEEYSHRVSWWTRYPTVYRLDDPVGVYQRNYGTSGQASEPFECNQASGGQTRVQGSSSREGPHLDPGYHNQQRQRRRELLELYGSPSPSPRPR